MIYVIQQYYSAHYTPIYIYITYYYTNLYLNIIIVHIYPLVNVW